MNSLFKFPFVQLTKKQVWSFRFLNNFNYEKQTLIITYVNGVSYEYIGVPRNIYVKFVNAASTNRFAKRHIYGNYIYRKSGEGSED